MIAVISLDPSFDPKKFGCAIFTFDLVNGKIQKELWGFVENYPYPVIKGENPHVLMNKIFHWMRFVCEPFKQSTRKIMITDISVESSVWVRSNPNSFMKQIAASEASLMAGVELGFEIVTIKIGDYNLPKFKRQEYVEDEMKCPFTHNEHQIDAVYRGINFINRLKIGLTKTKIIARNY